MKLLISLAFLIVPFASNAEGAQTSKTAASSLEYTAICSNGNKVKFKAGADLSRAKSKASQSCQKSGFGESVSVSLNTQIKATDHNSSRSNKTSSTPIAADSSGDGDDTQGMKATDYNSSRSNKADGAKADSESEDKKEASAKKKAN